MTVQSTQLLHLAEETSDLAQDGGLSKDATDNIWDARYNKIKNLLDPTEPGDAVTLRYIAKNQDSLLNQLKNTGAAQNSSIVSTGDSQNARLTSTGDTQNTRLNTTGDTQDKRLNDLGQKYVDLMTTLKDTATTKATEASNSAELSKKWAMSDTSPDGVTGNKSSKTWAEAAKTSATHAYTSESNAATFRDKADTYQKRAAASATAADNSASASKSSANASASSASAASTSAGNAKKSETNAAKSATAAAKSAVEAAKFDPTGFAKLTEIFPLTDKGRLSLQGRNITDLNDINCLVHPSWTCMASAYTSTMSNCPTKTAFYLYNLRNGTSIGNDDTLPNLTSYWYYIVQILIDISGNTWVRDCFNSAKEKFIFGAWRKIASLADLPTKTSQLTNDSGYATTETVDAEVQKWKKAYNNLRKRSHPSEFDDDELTILMETAIGSGDITLSQPYTNFDGLLIEYADDDSNDLRRKYISVAELNARIKRATILQNNPTISLFNDQQYWFIFVAESKGFTTTHFPVWKENAKLFRIYGVKFKEIK